jgi:hypothetical protein
MPISSSHLVVVRDDVGGLKKGSKLRVFISD